MADDDQARQRSDMAIPAADRLLNPTFDQSALDELAEFGSSHPLRAGEVLYGPGDERWNFYVVLEGGIEVVRLEDHQAEVIASYSPGQFVGELWMVTGQLPYLTIRASRDGKALAVPPAELRRLLATRPTIADTIFGAFVARRQALRESPAALAIRILGYRYSSEAMALRTFAARNRLPHTWIDLEEADDVEALLTSMGLRAGDTPVVITPTAVLARATPGEFAKLLGLTYRPIPGRTFDLVVVGTGPAGLASSVYGASEGLDTVALDATGPGGQAGSSSRIENYAGFPNGVSGSDLTARTSIQAQRLGAWLVSPCQVAGIRTQDGFHVVHLVDDSEIPCRSIVVATGAEYRRLSVPDLDRFEGKGVYYAATDLEARTCAGAEVMVVGGGNSAGQAALFLSQQGCQVTVVIRRPDLSSSMSRYLVDRIDADPSVEVRAETEVRDLGGDTHLTRVTLEHTPTGECWEIRCGGLFCFIGAVPSTSWLEGSIALDPKGFILTDRSLPDDFRQGDPFGGRQPLPFETSAPGVFAVGDVRLGSMKRVASAVGEGSSVVRSVHEYLADGG
jgi:thioredoxin reductase (NADPH)